MLGYAMMVSELFTDSVDTIKHTFGNAATQPVSPGRTLRRRWLALESKGNCPTVEWMKFSMDIMFRKASLMSLHWTFNPVWVRAR